MDAFFKFTGTIDRRSPPNEGDMTEPLLRENWLCRNGILKKPDGTERAITTILSDIPRWMGRYYTIETGVAAPKTFAYTKDGIIWIIDDQAQTAVAVKTLLNTNAYPRHQLFKTANQTRLYLVDGNDLYRYDGNSENNFIKVGLTDNAGKSIVPIDVIEHRDRLWLLSKTNLYASKNLDPENFSNANDSLNIIVGSGRGHNLAFARLGYRLYIFNTEGIFVVEGDVISALASTFEVRIVDERKIIAARSVTKVEKAILFVADNYELWSFDGSSAQMLTYKFILRDFINPIKELLDKAVATYFNNYYMLSFVEKGQTEPNMEIWWDSLENKIDIVRGRNISCYLDIDPAEENDYLQSGRSDIGMIMNCDRGYNFDGTAITVKLRTRDIPIAKGVNVRLLAFYPEITPTGNRNIVINYLLDGRLSNSSGADAFWTQNLRGEVNTLGTISIGNQNQFTDRVRPKINYARGESIAFRIEDTTVDLRADFRGIGIDFIKKHERKGKLVGA